MSQTSKRPGSRDISELKARLGLKKAKPAAKGAGVVPPPGARIGAIPAPPGAAPPQIAIPDATEDPFGAMNAMAARGAVGAAPAIVVVNDGTPVESVAHKDMAITIAKIAGLMLIPLILGVVLGKLSASANAHNATIDASSKLKDDVKKVGDSLVKYQTALQLAREQGPGGNSFSMDEKHIGDLNDSLAAVKPHYPDTELAASANLGEVTEDLARDLLLVQSETLTLYKDIKEHIEQSRNAAKVIKKGVTKVGTFNPYKYAGVIDIPTKEESEAGKPISFRFVELGMPVCPGDPKPNPNGCPSGTNPVGFGYRLDELGNWGTKKLTEAQGDLIAGDRIILFDPGTKVFDQLVKGGEASVAETSYMTRLEGIEKRLTDLIDLRKNVEQRLNNISNKGKKFTWFM